MASDTETNGLPDDASAFRSGGTHEAVPCENCKKLERSLQIERGVRETMGILYEKIARNHDEMFIKLQAIREAALGEISGVEVVLPDELEPQAERE